MNEDHNIRSYKLNDDGSLKLQRFYFDSRLWLIVVAISDGDVESYIWWSMEDATVRESWETVALEIKERLSDSIGNSFDRVRKLKDYCPTGWGLWGLGNPACIRNNDLFDDLNEQVFQEATSKL
ncbi:hypothetical protein HCH_01456 [Hahella chejuensis KCTC 2396]|uniref:Uncharacterized protein n=1 Tax=Hahella chejuensis (strain KCTC 2396) TaxID=349521 RepID=Q2SM08_HAHCH|nr:hypothetical protein [Hahella chejuensis]ABC28316.1 hypothetical protein HCH_01456 [Hahella chejuensis KCTC 2396]